ncbi:substrate-binding domain-containing protein [Planktothrix mougeotii]|uniref:Substrate-binding domain-containing protein n=1 Tax=Planktothrix mougeotii LEGE 06226 TaxID=1828728 RepID=A0ABR9UCV5_9CYAN|nr:substrate-binding domain-containing protein [Planktothrix mougeotii]MBE9144293.1 substrate-binding domain-containing protein [Planktothrix mougeotii LEGE 06226]
MSEVNRDTTYALLVGIEKYDTGSSWNLDGPANDVYKFAKWLHNNKVPAKNISIVLSPLDKNKKIAQDIESLIGGKSLPPATADNIKNFFEPKNINSKKHSLFLFFWAGHGCINNQTNERCLYFADATSAHFKYISINQVQSAMKTDLYNNIPKQIFFIDACAYYKDLNERNIPLEYRIHDSPKINSLAKQFALFAAQPGETAINRETSCGLFSKNLLTILENLPDKKQWPPDMATVTTEIKKVFADLREKDPKIKQIPVVQWKDWEDNETTVSNLSKPDHPVAREMRSDKAVILDFDGIVVDTEKYHLRAYNILILKCKYQEEFKEKVITLSDNHCDLEKLGDCISWNDYKQEYIELPTKEIFEKLITERSNIFQEYKELNRESLMEQKNIIYKALIQKTLEDKNDDRLKLKELFGANNSEWNSLERRGIYEYFKRGLGDLEPRKGFESLLKLLQQFNWDVKIISLSTRQIIGSAIEQVASGLSTKESRDYFKTIPRYTIDYLDRSKNSTINSDSENESIEIKKRLYEHIRAQNKHWNKDRIIAIEDGYRGRQAAEEAGFRSVFVPLHSANTEGKDFNELSQINCAELMRRITPRIFHVSKSNHAYSKAISDLLDSSRQDQKYQVSDYVSIHIDKADEVEKPEAQVERLKHLSYYAATQFLPDSLIITPAQNNGNLAEKLDNLASKGVKIITLDTRVDRLKAKDSKPTSPWVHISPDFSEGGKIAAQLIIEALKEKKKGKGKVAIFAGPEDHASTVERRQGFLGTIIKEAPDVQVVKIEYCRFTDADKDIIKNSVKALLQEKRYGLIEAIFCEADILADQVLEACKLLNAQPPIIVGFDGIKEQIAQKIVNKEIYASINVKVDEQVKKAWRIAISGKDWDLDPPQCLIKPEKFTEREARDYVKCNELRSKPIDSF